MCEHIHLRKDLQFLQKYVFVCKKYAVFACCYCDEIIKSRAPRYEEMLPIYSGKCILRQNESI